MKFEKENEKQFINHYIEGKHKDGERLLQNERQIDDQSWRQFWRQSRCQNCLCLWFDNMITKFNIISNRIKLFGE